MAAEAGAAGEATSAGRWQTLISGPVLDEEAKLIRTRLTGNLQTVATYNNSIDATSTDTLVLTGLAAIAERTAAEVRWKERADTIRQLAYDVYSAVGSRGGKAFRETQTPFERLRDAMDGARVEVEVGDDPLQDLVDRSTMMIRIKQGSDWLRTQVSSDSQLADADTQRDAVREASVLAALAELVAQPGYDYSDEEEYHQMTADFVDAALGIRSAAEGNDFNAFQQSYKDLMKQCGVCHGRYQFQ